MKSSQHDVEQPPETVRTLAEWKKPLLVTFVFLAFITTGFVSYTYVYFNRLDQRMDTDEALSNDVEVSVVSEDLLTEEADPCDDDSYRSWETFNISEINVIYCLNPIENVFYLQRPQGPELSVNFFACPKLRTFAQELFFKIFKELKTTFGFDRVEDLMGRMTGMINMKNLYNEDYVWAWSNFDTEQYFVNLENSVLSYVASGPYMHNNISKEELRNTTTIQFECPGVTISKGLKFVEMGWMAVGPTTYPEQHAEHLLTISAFFKSDNVWRTLADDCIAKYVKSIQNLEIKSYCNCSPSQVNCMNDTCEKVWEWPTNRSIGFKIWYQDGQWTLAYRSQ